MVWKQSEAQHNDGNDRPLTLFQELSEAHSVLPAAEQCQKSERRAERFWGTAWRPSSAPCFRGWLQAMGAHTACLANRNRGVALSLQLDCSQPGLFINSIPFYSILRQLSMCSLCQSASGILRWIDLWILWSVWLGNDSVSLALQVPQGAGVTQSCGRGFLRVGSQLWPCWTSNLSPTCWAVMAPSSVSILDRLHVTIQEGGVRTNMLLVGGRTQRG